MGRLVLGLDLEGMNENIKKGINLQVDRVTEVGAVLFDWETKMPVKMQSELINEPDRLPISEENTKITGITEDMLLNWGAGDREGIRSILQQTSNLMLKADCIMAHNCGSALNPRVGYDYQMLRELFWRYKVPMPETLWVNTLHDLEFPEDVLGTTRGALSMMALEYAHGFINPFPHRAVTDVLALLKIASKYDIEAMLERAKSPIVELQWSLPYPHWKAPQEEKDYFEEQKAKASAAKFWWQPERKLWTKAVKECDIGTKLVYDFNYEIAQCGQDPVDEHRELDESTDIPF